MRLWRRFEGEAGRRLGPCLDLLLPPRCAACERHSPTALCVACLARLPRLASHEPRGVPEPLAACVAEAAYEGDALAWIQRFKYPQPGFAGLDPAPGAVVSLLARRAARRLLAAPGRAPCWGGTDGPAVVVPIPGTRGRVRARGFDPAGVVAREVASELALPYPRSLLVRARDTRSQTGLGRRARRLNVAGAFRTAASPPARVVLVDDVVTTGSTLAEAARTLRRAGAHRVVAVCVAWTRDAGISAATGSGIRALSQGVPGSPAGPARSEGASSSERPRPRERPRGSPGSADRDRPAS